MAYLAENRRIEMGSLEELNSDLAHHDADTLRVGLAKDLAIELLLLDSEVEVGRWGEESELAFVVLVFRSSFCRSSLAGDITHRPRRSLRKPFVR